MYRCSVSASVLRGMHFCVMCVSWLSYFQLTFGACFCTFFPLDQGVVLHWLYKPTLVFTIMLLDSTPVLKHSM